MIQHGVANMKWPHAITIGFLGAVLVLIPWVRGCYQFGSSVEDPCVNKECPFGAECISSFNGRTGECVCPRSCPLYGDSRGSRPVCGSDGRDYPNLCELNRRACSAEKTIYIRYNGSCDPCYGVKCPSSQICQVDDNRNPICKCSAACGKDFSPVCGSDGNTYINECILRVEACRSRKSLRILHQGACAENNACKALKCSLYQECEIDRFGIATCQCFSACSKVLKPVCGTDGETYDSECELRRQACLHHRNVSVRYMGACDPESFCHKNHGICKFGAVCKLSALHNHTCICPECSEEYAPVCASNDVTYVNSCKFRQDMCEKKQTASTLREGACAGCENTNCQFYSNCETTELGGRCVCPDKCDQTPDPVCGSDLVTYHNECELRVSSCRKREFILVIKRGSCNSCHNVHCDYGARCENGVCVCPRKCPTYLEPVCGSNNVTYDNLCNLMAASCQSTIQITVQFKGPCEQTPLLQMRQSYTSLCEHNTCKYGAFCVTDGNMNNLCFCNFNCSTNKNYSSNKICGSDGRIYDSECAFQEEMCNRQQEIKRMENVFCDKFRNIPCQGEPPLVNPVTKREFECHTDSCPKNSYCHKGPKFAKCCKEMDLDEDCRDTFFGCCPDEQTPALGANFSGCPSVCQCNRLGAYLARCDPQSKQCYCKPGVGGLHCDRCEAGFWGLHKISEGNAGCIPCKCNQIGSSRDDCEQMSGRCVCKPGFDGMKCDICSDKLIQQSESCPVHANISLSITCLDSSQCNFGSVCRQSECVCTMQCLSSRKSVCASDGILYQSECHLKLASCRLQKQIVPVEWEKCSWATTLRHSATTSPVRRSTEYQNYGNLTKLPRIDHEILLNTGPTMPTIEQGVRLISNLFFDGLSLVEMPTLQAYSKVVIQMEINAFAADGIILYNSQTSGGEGDYIALILRNAYVELRFNLGSGTVVLRSSKPISLGTLVQIEVHRHLSEAHLLVDNEDKVMGKSEGPHKLLDLGHSLYLGGTPLASSKRMQDVLGVKRNYTGCIRSIALNMQNVSLSEQSTLLNTGTCTTDKCSRWFCKYKAHCVEMKNSFQCSCPTGYSGRQCEFNVCQESDYFCNQSLNLFPILDFWNKSYLQLPTLQGVGQAFVIEVWLMTRAPNGLVLYNGHSQGDFLELIINDGYIYYNYNLGDAKSNNNNSGIVSIRSANQLSLGDWHRIVISRRLKNGTLQVDDEPVIENSAKGNLNELNLDQPLYLGGTEALSNETSFNGAIQRLVINNQVWRNLVPRSVHAFNVQPFEGPPCGYENPCLNEGRCLPWLNEYVCHCSKQYHGLYCEKDVTSLPPITMSLKESSTVMLNSTKLDHNIFEMALQTRAEDGLLIWISQENSTTADYLAVVIANGYLEFSFNLGKQSKYLAIKSPIRINDGELHLIFIWRYKQLGLMEIDSKYLVGTTSNPGATDLNTNGRLVIGSHEQLPAGLPSYYYHHFFGCLEHLTVDGQLILGHRDCQSQQ